MFSRVFSLFCGRNKTREPSQSNHVIIQIGGGHSFHQENNIVIQNTRSIDDETINTFLESLPLHGKKFQIQIHTDRGPVKVTIQHSFTINCVKRILGLMLGIRGEDAYKIVLIFETQVLKDQLRIEDYGIKNDSILKMFYNQSDLSIAVHWENGRTFCVPIQSESTMLQVKEEIYKEEGLPVHSQILYVDGVELLDWKNVNDYEYLYSRIIRLREKCSNLL